MPALTWKLNKSIAFGPKILRSERERFCSIMNFVSKTNIFDFWGEVSRKTKANNLLKNLGLTLLVFKQYMYSIQTCITSNLERKKITWFAFVHCTLQPIIVDSLDVAVPENPDKIKSLLTFDYNMTKIGQQRTTLNHH
jgi:hypothetical protein